MGGLFLSWIRKCRGFAGFRVLAPEAIAKLGLKVVLLAFHRIWIHSVLSADFLFPNYYDFFIIYGPSHPLITFRVENTRKPCSAILLYGLHLQTCLYYVVVVCSRTPIPSVRISVGFPVLRLLYSDLFRM